MKPILCLSLLTTAAALSFSAYAVEGNFQASILTYGDPLSAPRVAYSVPAGQNLSFYSSREIADDVILSGSSRVIAGVNFEYYANYAESGGLTFRMYNRDEEGLPGSLIYSIPLDILNGGGLVNIAFNYDANNILPQRFFYSVQFSDVENGQVAGMIIPDQAAATGYSSDRLWEKVGNNWVPLELSAVQGNQLGLAVDGDKLRLVIVSTPRTTLAIQSNNALSAAWIQVAEVETDDNGQAVYEEDIDSRDQVYYRTVAP